VASVQYSEKLKNIYWLVFFVIAFTAIAIQLGTDATPDFKIAHHYLGYAFLNNRQSIDISPVGFQSNFYYGVDVVYYLLITKLNNHPNIINIILSLPYAICAFCVFLLARQFVEVSGWGRNLVAASAGVLGLTGASALPTLATSMTDILPGLPYVVALTFWLWFEIHKRNTLQTSSCAGFVAGLSVGMKLTQAPLFVALFITIAIRQFLGNRNAWKEAFLFGIFGVIAFSMLSGHWLWSNYASTGNPFFPIMNNIFKSDLVAHGAFADTRFFPRTWKMELFYPAYWTFLASHFAIELNMRDARVFVGLLSAVAIILAFVLRRSFGKACVRDEPLRLAGFYLAVVYVVSYLFWLKIWSIYRYLAIQECLSAVMLLAALRELAGRYVLVRHRVAIYAALAVTIAATTQYPWWSRAQPAPVAVQVRLPTLEPDAMMLVLDMYAHGYVFPYLTPSVPIVGARTNLSGPGSAGQLQVRIETAIKSHKGPLWGIDFPQGFPGMADEALAGYGLRRGSECSMVETNIENKPTIRICRLERQ